MKQCLCKEIMEYEFHKSYKLYLHLSGCPQGSDYKKYKKLHWFKKLFKQNPYKNYLKYHVNRTIGSY